MRNSPGLRPSVQQRSSTAAAVLFDLLNPIPFGCFVAALIFDVVYANSAFVMWFKSAAWLIVIGLLFAVIPRLINLAWVWFPIGRPSTAGDKGAFFLYLLGVAAAIVNAFVHGRDAYAIVPEGLLLSTITVVLLMAGNVLLTFAHSNNQHEVNA